MKKKFLALVLTLAMVLSLVPATALATNGTQEGNNQGPVEVTGSDSDNNLTMKKTVRPVPNEDGTYTVRLESYATGEVKNTTTTKQLDIVLLLDVSGSMNESFTESGKKYQAVYSESLKENKTYYVKNNNKYKKVTYCSKCNAWTRDCKNWFFEHKEGSKFIPKVSENDADVTHTQFYEYVYTEGQSKMSALKQAVNKFIDDIAQNSPNSNVSIVKFAGKESSDIGDSKYQDGSYTYNYTQVVKDLTQVNSSGATALKNAVSALNAAGATSSDYGLKKAKDALKSAKQDKVIVLFTDGEPNHDNGFDYEVATNAVNTAKDLKQNNTTIYTVGVFQNPSNDIHQYMSSVSSNHPNATAQYISGENWWDKGDWMVTGGDSDFGTYYKTANNTDELINAFRTISSQVSSTDLDASAVVVDNVPSNFALNKGSVQVYTADCTGKNEKGELIWSETLDPVNSDITTTIPENKNEDGSQTISTTGFKFSENWCGLDSNNEATGKKLIIEFTISSTNYGGTQPTNAGAYIKAKKADEKPIISLKDPTVPVTISLGSKENSLKNPEVKDEKTYDGTGLAILPKIAEKANDLATGTDNAYVDMELTVKVDDTTTYTYEISAGKKTGSWYKDSSTDPMTGEQIAAVRTPKDVNRDQGSKEVKPYTYKFDLKLSDANPKDAESGAESKEYKDNNASFKITPRNVTLTSATDSKEYDGNPLTNDTITEGDDGFVEGEGATYTVTGYRTDVGESNNTFDYKLNDNTKAGNYTITPVFGKLIITEKTEVPYTLIFDANGGVWNIGEISGYTLNTDKNQATKSGLAASYRVDTSTVAEPKKENATFLGWGTRTECFSNLALKPTVAVLKKWLNPENEGNTVTLYAVWKTEETPDPAGNCTYTIRQHYWKNLNDTDTGDNVSIKNLTAKSDEKIASLIDGKDKDQDWRGYRYLYDNQQTKITVPGEESTQLTKDAVLSVSGTVIDLYYYLDSWKDGNTQDPAGKDEKTGGDGTPDYKQILIEYKAHTPLVGEVSREFEIQTLTDDQKVATPTGAKAKAKENVAYAFAYWIKGKVDSKKTEAAIENTAICYEKQLSGVTIDPVTGGGTYIYTAVFLKDVTGKIEEGKEKPDGIPDAWQCKVTFKVENGSWDDNTNKDIVKYVTKKNAEGNGSTNGTAKLTAGQIPPVGNQPSSGYKASGSWDKTPPTDFNITGDTVFTYTYDQKSGGSGSGGSNRPKPPVVEIPDDVPTGLNGKDHYAYVVGYPDGMVYPQKNITRAEVATIFFRLLTDETREANMTKSNSYNDMKDGAWYTCAVSTLSKMGIIKGYEDGSFKPDASISRAEFAAIAARFDPDGDKTPATFSDVSSHWAKDEISIAANHGWIKGYEDGSFKPDQKITRAETMTLVNRVLKRLPETKDDLHKDMKTWPDNQNESAWFYLAVQEATNSHYQNLKKDGTHETWESMRETRDWAALEK